MTYTVMRTAAGSPVAPFVIRALKSLPDVRVVAVDIEPLSGGFHLADAHHVVPLVRAPEFLETMLEVCQQEQVDLLFPDLDEELPLLARARAQFEAVGTDILLSDVAAIDTCIDKLRTYQLFREHGIPTPRSFMPEDLRADDDLHWPLIIKPRSGRGSQGVFKLNQPRELEFFVDYVEKPIIQEFVDGTEYTIDTLSDREGNFLYCSIRQRLTTDSGISIRGRTVEHPKILEYVKQIVETLQLIGPGCIQCLENSDGEVKFTEVNPRIAGSAALSLAAGAPIVTDSVRLMRGEPTVGPTDYRLGTVMLRQWEELFLDESGHPLAL